MNHNDEKKRIVYVVHGRNLLLKKEIFKFLKSLNLIPKDFDDAIRLTQKPNPGIIEVLNAALKNAQVILVMFTPDDEARLKEDFWSENERSDEIRLMGQPRLNVIFEAGLAYQKCKKRTILIQINDPKLFSDISGIHILKLDDSPEKRKRLIERLETAGCYILKTNNKWRKTGSFSQVKKIPKKKTLLRIPKDKTWDIKDWLHQKDRQYRDSQASPDYKINQDISGKSYLYSKIPIGHHLNFEVQESSPLLSGKNITICLDYGSSGWFYIKTLIVHRSTSQTRHGWIRIWPGEKFRAKYREQYEEWDVWLQFEKQENNWKLFKINIPELIQKTYGTQRFELSQFLGFRIRSEMKIAQLEIYK